MSSLSLNDTFFMFNRIQISVVNLYPVLCRMQIYYRKVAKGTGLSGNAVYSCFTTIAVIGIFSRFHLLSKFRSRLIFGGFSPDPSKI